MNIRCSFCQTPYTLGRVAMLDALQEVDANNLSHYDAHCPRCRRSTRIERRRLEMAMPNWREELKQFEKEMKAHPQHEAPLPKPETAAVAEAAPAPEPVAEAPKETSAKKPAKASAIPEPKAAGKKPVAKKPAAKGTSKKSK